MHGKRIGAAIVAAACAIAASTLAADGGDPPPELGRVRWQRDFDAALSASARSSKPLFLFFQEVPG